MSKVGVFKLEDKFQVTGKNLVLMGQVQGSVHPGSYIRFEEGGVFKNAKIERVDHGHRNDHAFVGLILDSAADKYFDVESEKLVGKEFDIVE